MRAARLETAAGLGDVLCIRLYIQGSKDSFVVASPSAHATIKQVLFSRQEFWPAVSKRVAIVQSNYIPWKGYFDLINLVDEFILFDDVQYTKRDWRNRNLIKTAAGLHWLTVPVQVKGKYHQRIRDTRVSDSTWAQQHWQTLFHHYKRAPHFAALAPYFQGAYEKVAGMDYLSDVNRVLIEAICGILEIDTAISASMAFEIVEGKNERLLFLCQQASATEYLSGPAAREYLDETTFRAAGIQVRFMDYGGYPEYPQLHPPFEHGVSILDLLFNTGADAPRYMKSFSR
jgi:hypothetical protein